MLIVMFFDSILSINKTNIHVLMSFQLRSLVDRCINPDPEQRPSVEHVYEVAKAMYNWFDQHSKQQQQQQQQQQLQQLQQAPVVQPVASNQIVG